MSTYITIREKYGFTDEEVIALLVLERESLSEFRKKRRVLYDGLMSLLGINDDDLDKAKGIRWSKQIAQTIDSLGDEKSRVFGIYDIVKRCGPAIVEQEYFLEKVKAAIEGGFLRALPSGFFVDKTKIHNMAWFLDGYLRSRLVDSPTTKTAKKGVTPASFAAFLRDALPYMEEFRKAVYGKSVKYSFVNYVTKEHWTLAELEEDLDKGLELIASESASDQEAGAELVIQVAKKGRVPALLLYATHVLADSGKKAEIEQALVWLYAIEYRRDADSPERLIASDLLDGYYEDKLDEAVPGQLEDEELCNHYVTFFNHENPQTIDLMLGEAIHGVALIGNVKIICGWFDKLANIIVGKDYVEAYLAPCLPTWYAIHLMVEKLGKNRLNELAGVQLYSDGEDDLKPAWLQYPVEGEGLALTHYLCPGESIMLGDSALVIEKTESEEVTFQADDSDGYTWRLGIPEKWDFQSVSGQRRLIRTVNTKIAKMAETILPQIHKTLLEANELPVGKCVVSVKRDYDWVENEDGGIDVTVPFELIKLPGKVVDAILFSGYSDEGGELEQLRQQFDDGVVNSYSTTWASYKLLAKKLKFYPGDWNIV